VAVAPIVVDDRPVGALLVASRRERSELAESPLGAAAGQLALVLEQAWRERELRAELHRAERRIRQLEASIAEGARLERELMQRNRELLALSDIARALNQAVGLEEVLRRAVDHVVDVMQVEASMVRLLEGEELVLTAHRGLSAEFVAKFERLPIARSTSGMVVRLGKPQVIDDCRTDERVVLPGAAEEGIVSLALLPMVVKGKVVGVLNALSRRPRRFTEDDVRLLSTMAAEIGVAVENARLYEAECQRSATLEELSRLKTDFVLTVSHELRTPMAIVKASLDALWGNWEDVDEGRRRAYVAVGRQGANRLKRLLEDLLLVSRIETSAFAPRLEPVEVAPLVREIVGEVLAEHPKRLIDVSLPPNLPPALADRAALGEIVSNLLDNAIKYSAPEMPVSLTAEVVDHEVRVSVADRGIGIAPGDMGRLFQRFERIDPTVRSRPGTGLGLYICRQLAESMGGRIWAESVLAHGSTFTVGLRPAAAGAAGPAEQPASSHAPTLGDEALRNGKEQSPR
jgi:signal transduction histidine kinase